MFHLPLANGTFFIFETRFFHLKTKFYTHSLPRASAAAVY